MLTHVGGPVLYQRCHGEKEVVVVECATGGYKIGVRGDSKYRTSFGYFQRTLPDARTYFDYMCAALWPQLSQLQAMGLPENEIGLILDVYEALDHTP